MVWVGFEWFGKAGVSSGAPCEGLQWFGGLGLVLVGSGMVWGGWGWFGTVEEGLGLVCGGSKSVGVQKLKGIQPSGYSTLRRPLDVLRLARHMASKGLPTPHKRNNWKR